MPVHLALMTPKVWAKFYSMLAYVVLPLASLANRRLLPLFGRRLSPESDKLIQARFYCVSGVLPWGVCPQCTARRTGKLDPRRIRARASNRIPGGALGRSLPVPACSSLVS